MLHTDERLLLLTDADLKDAISNGLAESVSIDNWQTMESSIQPCSLDLHIGLIQIPAEREQDPERRIDATGDDVVLSTGGTAVVTTVERLKVPANVAAIGFPPSHVSIKGLLMTNPGHVDPGYDGPMHFTVINMGRAPYTLRIGDPIYTAIFFRLDKAVSADWRTRQREAKSASGGSKKPEELKPGLETKDVNRLSRDFLNLEKRATKIARSALHRAALYSGIIALAVTILSNVLPYWLGGVEDVKRSNAVLVEQVQELTRRVSALEAKQPNSPPKAHVSNSEVRGR